MVLSSVTAASTPLRVRAHKRPVRGRYITTAGMSSSGGLA
jgi:hypothetical protein